MRITDTIVSMSRRAARPSGVFGLAVLSGITIVHAQDAAFYPMGLEYPNGLKGNIAGIQYVTDFGTTMGLFWTEPGPIHYSFTWSTTSGYILLEGLSSTDVAVSVQSADPTGNIIVGAVFPTYTTGPFPVIWVDRKIYRLFDLPPNHYAAAVDVSWDGMSIVGPYIVYPVSTEAFLFENMKQLKLLGGLTSTSISAGLTSISADGNTAAGASSVPSGQMGALWTRESGWEGLGDLTGAPPYFSSLSDLSLDGKVAVGRSFDQNGEEHQARWTRFHGWQDMGKGSSIPTVSGDGYVHGARTVGLGASIWNPRDGWRSLREVLEVNHNLSINWIAFHQVQAVSNNGEYFSGYGANENNELEAFLVKLPAFCYADCNADKTLDIFDYLCFTQEFNKQSVYANCDNDGSMNIFDYICFGNHFAAGCAQ